MLNKKCICVFAYGTSTNDVTALGMAHGLRDDNIETFVLKKCDVFGLRGVKNSRKLCDVIMNDPLTDL